MYVNYFDRVEKLPHENPTIGILLCADKNDAVVKFSLPENQKQIFASQYQLYLPTEKMLLDEMQKEIKSFEQKVEEAAQESEKQTMIAEAIADKEKIKLDDKTYKKMLKEYAKTYGFEDGDAMEKAYSKDTLKEAMLTDLVKDWLVDNCIQKTDN